jgi:hypothetical protein
VDRRKLGDRGRWTSRSSDTSLSLSRPPSQILDLQVDSQVPTHPSWKDYDMKVNSESWERLSISLSRNGGQPLDLRYEG